MDKFYHSLISFVSVKKKKNFFLQILKNKLQSALEVANYAKENIPGHLSKNIPAQVNVSETERYILIIIFIIGFPCLHKLFLLFIFYFLWTHWELFSSKISFLISFYKVFKLFLANHHSFIDLSKYLSFL